MGALNRSFKGAVWKKSDKLNAGEFANSPNGHMPCCGNSPQGQTIVLLTWCRPLGRAATSTDSTDRITWLGSSG